MKLEKLTDIWGAGKWLLLGVVYFVLTLVYLQGRWELYFAIPYTLGFLSVAIVLSEQKEQSEWKVNPVTALCATLIGLLSVYVSGYASHDGASQTVAYISIVIFIVLLGSEFTEIFSEFDKESSLTKYLLLIALVAWAFWAFDYFRLRMVWQIPFETALNHGGIMLLAANESLKLLGIKYGIQKEGIPSLQDKLSVVFVLVTVLGAFLLVEGLGWGLGLIPLP